MVIFMRGLYIHIPFCKHICNYCDFPKRVAQNNNQIEEYIDFICNDFENYKNYFNSIKTIYIGGGTPNLLSDFLLDKFLNKIKEQNFNVEEYTIECNPEFISQSQILILKKYGVNRISLGVESFIDEDLKKLNRHHTSKEAIDAVKLLKENQFDNINIDLIFAHPFDSLDKIKKNLEIFYDLGIPHLSYYSMILEEKTVFNHLLNLGKIKLLDNDTEANMYEYIISNLKEHGYHHYETSNFAYKGYESKHNQIYWDSNEYIGIGAGASGYLDSVRYTFDSRLNHFYNHDLKEKEIIDIDEKKKEFFLLGFRKIDGVSIAEYKSRFNSDPFNDFVFNKLEADGLIYINKDRILLTKKGIMLANDVFMEFV